MSRPDESALLLATAPGPVRDNLRGIHERGLALVVDRFGLGDGDLGALAGLPVSVLKLDRGVAARITDDEPTRALVALVVAAAAERGGRGDRAGRRRTRAGRRTEGPRRHRRHRLPLLGCGARGEHLRTADGHPVKTVRER
jgi:hypothetical protein